MPLTHSAMSTFTCRPNWSNLRGVCGVRWSADNPTKANQLRRDALTKVLTPWHFPSTKYTNIERVVSLKHEFWANLFGKNNLLRRFTHFFRKFSGKNKTNLDIQSFKLSSALSHQKWPKAHQRWKNATLRDSQKCFRNEPCILSISFLLAKSKVWGFKPRHGWYYFHPSDCIIY